MANLHKNTSPPKWLDKLLSFYCNPERYEEVQGDLHELFYERVKEEGANRAKVLYCYDMIRCIRGYTIKRPHNFSNKMMIKNYLTIAFRNIIRHKSYAAINAFGLALGIISFSLIFIFVRHELSFDHFHEKKEQIYVTPFTWHFGNTTLPVGQATSNVGPILKREFPEVQEFLRLNNGGLTIINTGDFLGEDRGFLYADSTFFDLLSFELIYGNEKKCLTEPYSLVLTEDMAKKYFAESDDPAALIGKQVKIDNARDYIITGIVKNPPANSHIQFNFLASFSSLRVAKEIGGFNTSAYMTYVLLSEGARQAALQEKIDQYLLSEFGEEKAVTIGLAPLKDVYLNYHLSTGVGPTSDQKYIYIFSAIAILILSIACINYMNLATARSTERAKEVGVRKVMGAFRRQLTIQFLTEAMILSFAAIVVAILSIKVILPFFNTLVDKQLSFDLSTNIELLGVYLILWLSVTVLAGFYPALALSGFSPVSVLRGSFRSSSQGTILRKILVIFQFSISIVLIVGTTVIYRQLNYVNNKNLGYNKDQILCLPFDKDVRNRFDYFKTELTRNTAINSVTTSSQLPSSIGFETTFGLSEGDDQRQLMRAAEVDRDFIQTLGLELLEGNDQIVTNNADYAFAVNEEACRFFGWEMDEALGQRMKIWGGEWGEIVSVVKDFHYSSLHEEIKPLVLFSRDTLFMSKNILININGQQVDDNINFIKSAWDNTFNHRSFDYRFLDDQFDRLYKTESKLGQMFTIFSTLAIIIGCLGLLGLTSYTATQRSKEISIRKVLGASVSSIVVLIGRSFSKQILLALVLAIPSSYWIMNTWLEGFAYRINIGLDVMIMSAVITLFVAFATISYKVITAALQNPVSTLRSD